jgi:hypothetical protein
MPPTPLVEWGDDERAAGAVSFLERLLNATTTTTTPSPMMTTTTLQPFISKKVKDVVANILPHLTEAVVKEFTPAAVDVTLSTPTTPSTPSPTNFAVPPSCTPDHAQVIVMIFIFNCYSFMRKEKSFF